MVLDIREFRENPELVRESQRRRFESVEIVDEIIALDEAWRKAKFAVDQEKRDLGKIGKDMGAMHKAKKAGTLSEEDFKAKEAALLQQKKETEERIVAREKEEKELKAKVDAKLNTVGNIVHESVPVFKDEEHNVVYHTFGDAPSKPAPGQGLHHHELLAMIDGVDTERGAKVAGHRAYFLRKWGVKLNMALVQYGIDFLEQRGFTVMQTPYFMKRDCMARTAQLSDFDESLYKVVDDGDEKDELFMIATSEQPISSFHWNEWIQPKDLPLLYGGYSTNFRKEAGSHGKDCWGIFRVHQFEKIEQFVITDPAKSWEMHEQMLKNSEEFYQSLGLSYRVVNIVSGALNNAAAKKYDLEAWFPGFAEFRELVSCSNCTDYQSRALEVRFGSKKDDGNKKQYVHMLNSTLCATERALCCILENYQTNDGITVPEFLRPYLKGVDVIHFVKKKPVVK